jgi:hypothetical protein
VGTGLVRVAATSPLHGATPVLPIRTHLSPHTNAGPQAPTTRPTSRAASTAGTNALVEGAAADSMAAKRPGGGTTTVQQGASAQAVCCVGFLVPSWGSTTAVEISVGGGTAGTDVRCELGDPAAEFIAALSHTHS